MGGGRGGGIIGNNYRHVGFPFLGVLAVNERNNLLLRYIHSRHQTQHKKNHPQKQTCQHTTTSMHGTVCRCPLSRSSIEFAVFKGSLLSYHIYLLRYAPSAISTSSCKAWLAASTASSSTASLTTDKKAFGQESQRSSTCSTRRIDQDMGAREVWEVEGWDFCSSITSTGTYVYLIYTWLIRDTRDMIR